MGLTPLVWFVVGLVLMGMEIIVPGLILFWFGLGGLLTALFVWMHVLSFPVAQWVFFFVSSLAFLGAWVFFFKKLFIKEKKDDNRDPLLINLLGKVTKEIKPHQTGRVRLYENFHGIVDWAAEANKDLDVGTEVRVLEAKGIRLIVKESSDSSDSSEE